MLKEQNHVYTSPQGEKRRVSEYRSYDVLNMNVSMMDLQNTEDEDVIQCYELLVANHFNDEDELNF